MASVPSRAIGAVRRRTACCALLTALWAALLAGSQPVAARQRPDPPARAQLEDVQPLVRAVYATLRGTLVPAERPFGWSNAVFKGEHGNAYIPYTLTVERSKLTTPAVAMYVFATPHLSGARQATSGTRETEPDDARPPASPETAFEATYLVDLHDEPATGSSTISRALSLPPGTYDVYVAIGPVAETGAAGGSQVAARRRSTNDVLVLGQRLVVPDLWAAEFTTSSVVVADRVEALTAAPTPEQQIANPYIVGTWQIVPARDLVFTPSEELSVIFFVYNAGLTSSKKPDVTTDYVFHRRTASGMDPFSRTATQIFNAQTVPAFDAEAGHQIIGGQSVPLTGFPEGAYRLQIELADRTNGARLTRSVDFAVRGS